MKILLSITTLFLITGCNPEYTYVDVECYDSEGKLIHKESFNNVRTISGRSKFKQTNIKRCIFTDTERY